MCNQWIVAMLACLAIPEKLSFQPQHCSLQSINQPLMSVGVKIGKRKEHQTIFKLLTFSTVWRNAQRSILFGAFGNQALSNGENNSQLLEPGLEWEMANLFKHCLSVSVKLRSGLLHATLSIWRPQLASPPAIIRWSVFPDGYDYHIAEEGGGLFLVSF